MTDTGAQIRNKQHQALKCLPGVVTDEEKRSFRLATDIAVSSYPVSQSYLGMPLPVYYMELARVTSCEIGLTLPAVTSALLSGIREDS